MGDFLLPLLAFMVMPVIVLFGAAVLLTTWLRRANRVAPRGAAGGVPLTWLWSPGAAAAMHRRLRCACQLASTVAGPERARRWAPTGFAGREGRAARAGRGTSSIAELAREVMNESMRVDRELLTSHLVARGVARAHALAALDIEVRGVEDAARRVHRLASRQAQFGGASAAHALSLHERIATMEAAYGELQARP